MKWISIKDAQPKCEEDVLIYSKRHNNTFVGRLDYLSIDACDENIDTKLAEFYWMPIPELPKN